MRSFFGNVGVLVRMYCYIRTHGPEGLRSITENAVLNANYLLSRVKDILPVPQGDRCMHEFVASAAKLKAEREHVGDGHRQAAARTTASTPRRSISRWIVQEAMMIEPTETESKDTLDAFADTLRCIVRESHEQLHDAPTRHPSAGRMKSAPRAAGFEMDAARMTWECRLLRHEPAAGAWNMAADEVLLDRAEERAVPCLRFYGWSEPTLSLGYFQTYSDRQQHAASRHCAAVRRLTGGGAILHDNEITYSIVLPGGHPLAVRRDELYQAMHGCLIEALAGFGAAARLCEADATARTAVEPFLCFQRRSPGDVLLGEHKICGSAQRRRNAAVLQHGSLLWTASSAAPELPGVADLANRPIPWDKLMETWLDGLAERLRFSWRPEDLSATEAHLSKDLAESWYATYTWTQYRGRRAVANRSTACP